MTDKPDTYLEKSPDAGRMGKAAEFLVAAFCILASRGRLNASTSMVDDEGVDLVFHTRGGVSTLAVQVKARMSDSRGIQRGSFLAQVRQATFRPRADLDMLFVAVDIDAGTIIQAWLVPSANFRAVVGAPNNRGLLRFTASMKPTSRDRWAHTGSTPENFRPEFNNDSRNSTRQDADARARTLPRLQELS